MEILCHKSIADTYAVDSEKYCFTLLKDMDEASASFSVSTWEILRGHKIYFVSDLLNYSVIQLMKLAGFTDSTLLEIQRFASMLPKEQPLPQEIASEQEGPGKTATIDLQKLKECKIEIPIAAPLAQKYSIELNSALDINLFKIAFPGQIRKKLVIAGFTTINDVLTLSPVRMIREAGITLLDLPEVEASISAYVHEAYITQKDAAENTPGSRPPAAVDAENICAGGQKKQEITKRPSEIATEKSVPVTKDKTYAQIYNLDPALFKDDPISAVNLSAQSANVLRKNGIKTIADLLNTTPNHLLQLRNFGASSLQETERLLDAAKGCHKCEESAYAKALLPKKDDHQLSAEPPARSESIERSELADDGNQPQTPISDAHMLVDACVEASEKTYAEIFGLQPELHMNTLISELNLSVRTHNVFKRNQINTLGVLLKKSPESLMRLKNFGKTCLHDVESLLESLKGGSPAEQTPPPVQTQPSESLPLELRPYARQMANGDFSFTENPAMPTHILPAAEYCKEAQIALGTELANACLDSPQTVQHIISACFAFCSTVQQQNDLQVLLGAIPSERRCNKVLGYINAYVKDEEKRAKLQDLYPDADATIDSILDVKLNDEQYHLVAAFLKWCTYNLSFEIDALLKSIYTNERMKTVVQMRAQKKTLEQIGAILGITRERIRQIEAKAKRIFQSRQGRIKIISKIAADLNSASVVMPSDLMDYCGNLFNEVLYLLRTCESSNFTYDQTLDLFIVGDDALQDRTTAFVESLPAMFTINELASSLQKAAEDFDLPEEVAKKAISEVFKLTGDVYHRNRLSRAVIFQEILSEYFQDGIHIHNPEEIALFRDLVHKNYGDVNLSRNDRALAARIADICILCDRGKYRLKQKEYIPRSLATRIVSYMENSDHSIFMTNTLFHVFEDELRAHGVNSKYFLQGILHELYSDDYTFTRDYISKDASITSIYSSVVNHIRKSQHPVSKKQLKKVFPGIPEVALNLATSDPEVLQYLGEYLHSSKLVVSEQEKEYLHSVIMRLLKDGQPHHSEECYDIVIAERPEIFTRNSVSFQYRCFSVMEYLFRNQYEFSRPYIAPLGIEIGRPIEQLREFVDGNDRISITEISSYAAEIHFRLQSTLGFINSCNDRYLLISNEIMVLLEDTGVDESIAHLVEDLVCEEITDTALIRSLPCWMKLPPIKVPWTEWLVYSVLNKWGTRVEVAPSYNQFRMAVPLVSPKGKMQAEPFAEAYKELDCTAGNLSVSISNDLGHIDDLLIELTDEELLEDDLWD